MRTRRCRTSSPTTSSKKSTLRSSPRRSSPSSSSTSTRPNASSAKAASTSAPGNASTWSPSTPSRMPPTPNNPAKTPPTTSPSSSTKTSAPAAPSASTAAPPASSSSARSPNRSPKATPTPAPTATATATEFGSDGQARQRTERGAAAREGPRDRGPKGPRLAGVDVHLPARVGVPSRLHGQPPEPFLREHEQRAVPPSPGEGEAARGEGLLHALPGWPLVLPLHTADHHRHLLDVLLPPDGGVGVGHGADARDGRDVRLDRAEHAPVGSPPHGAHGVPAHEPRLLPRGLQVATRVQLGHRRDPAHADVAALVHGLPAAVGPAGAVGRDRRHQHVGLHAGVWLAGEVRPAGIVGDIQRHPLTLVHVARPAPPVRDRDLHGRPLLARPQGRRPVRAALTMRS